MPIDSLPGSPLPTDTPTVFDSKAYALLGALPTFVSQTNATAADVTEKQATASAAALAAGNSATAAGNSAAAASDSADAANLSALAAGSSATQAQNYAAALSATSTTSLAIGTGSKTFATQSGKQFVAGQPVIVSNTVTPSNYMHGTVTSYSGTSLIVSVTATGGTGTFAAWTIAVSGVQGPTGETGGISGGTLTGALNGATPATLASASTVNIGAAASNAIAITGTTTITALGTIAAGSERTLTFSGALTLTHNATSLILPGASNIVTAAGDVAVMQSLGAGNWRCINFQRASGTSVVTPSTIANLIRSARTSNTVLGVADKGTLIDVTSGTFTQTFAAVATLTNGWWCYIRNSGTGDITLDPNASELIDGLTSYVMYPGECRLVQCDGSALLSIVINAFTRTFTASGTFTKPPGYQRFAGLLWAPGGSGRKDAGGNAAGGGGGACQPFDLPVSDFGATETVTIGSGGAAQTSASTNGNPGGNSSLGSLVLTFGGGGGTNSTGGGGGVWSAGTSAGGNPLASDYGGAQTTPRHTYYGGGTASQGDGAAANGGIQQSHYGGAAGGTINGGTVYNAGISRRGGNGGAASLASNGTAGTAPGGGGGATSTGSQSGAGARGELQIWGVI